MVAFFVFVIVIGALAVSAALLYGLYRLWQAWTVIVPPNQTAVVFGIRGQTRFIRGGGKFVNRLFNRVVYLSHEPIQIPCSIANILTEDNHAVNVKADGVVRIGVTDEMLATAASQWDSGDDAKIQTTLSRIMDGLSRTVVSKTKLAMLRSDIQEVTRNIRQDAVPIFASLGIEFITFTITSLEDTQPGGGLSLLADQQIALVKRDVAISTSNAERETAVTVAENKTKSAEAENATRVRVAQLNQEATTAEAKAKQAPLLAEQEAQQAVIAAQVANNIANADGVNQMARNKAASDAQAAATQLTVAAEAEAEKTRIEATAARDRALLEAEASRATAEALNSFSQTAMLMQMLPQLLEVIKAGLDANASALASANITLLDSGNGGASANLANIFGVNLTSVLALLKSQGLDLTQVLSSRLTEDSASQNGHSSVAERELAASTASATQPLADATPDE